MKTPPVKLIFFYFLLLAYFSLRFEAETFRIDHHSDQFIGAYLSWFPVSLIFTFIFIDFFYLEKSTKQFLSFAGIFYIVYVAFRLIAQGGGGYLRNYHEVLVDGYLTAYGIAGITFNVFLAPLVLAINMYIFDIVFKKRFQRKQQHNQEKT